MATVSVATHTPAAAAIPAADDAAAAAAAGTSTSASAAAAADLRVTVEFSGGLELLFSRVKRQQLHFPVSDATPASTYTMRFLIEWLKLNRCTERHELFVTDDSVSVHKAHTAKSVRSIIRLMSVCENRPGILVLINDTDWELEDGLEYVLRDGDTIVFISTLHGG